MLLMNATTFAVFFGIAAAAAWGFSDFLSAKSAKLIGPITALVAADLLGTLILTVLYVLFLRTHVPFTLPAFGYAFVAGAVLSLGEMLFFLALNVGPVSIVSPLSSAYPLITTLVAVLGFKAKLSSVQLFAILLITAGILLATELVAPRKGERKALKGPLLALGAALLFGAGNAFSAQAINILGWQFGSLVEFISATACILAIVPFIKGDERISFRTVARGFGNTAVLGTSALGCVGAIALNVGFSASPASGGAFVTAISACSPLLTVFLALRHFKEHVAFIPLLGACAAVIGIVILSLS